MRILLQSVGLKAVVDAAQHCPLADLCSDSALQLFYVVNNFNCKLIVPFSDNMGKGAYD